ncbi:hypothetical protein MA16_Dca015856 [Dendrobium catenatum]|uniref:Uncharacterized protein n=1 Tax=Dendrobium catenatum TaxID=906689 RepID=A0A2I0X0M5_9ASPA|nr:hypothetical protein MA16_Dca015856 [Dendrobium catenatum]
MCECILIGFIVRLILILFPLQTLLGLMILEILLLCCVTQWLFMLHLVEGLVGGADVEGDGCSPTYIFYWPGNDVVGARFSVGLTRGNLWWRSFARLGWLLRVVSLSNWTV